MPNITPTILNFLMVAMPTMFFVSYFVSRCRRHRITPVSITTIYRTTHYRRN